MGWIFLLFFSPRHFHFDFFIFFGRR
jgi:hypothetical protein